jgi:membrane protein required for colicin V production
MNLTDLTLIGLLTFSTILGVWRGITREVLGLLGWGGSVFAAYLGYAPIAMLLESLIPHPLARNTIAALIVFVISLVLLTTIAFTISHSVKKSILGIADRFLGGCYGLVRASIILIITSFLCYRAFPEDQRPELIRDSKILATAHTVTTNFSSIISPSTLETGKKRLSDFLNSFYNENLKESNPQS